MAKVAQLVSGTARLGTRWARPSKASLLALDCDDGASRDTIPGTGVEPCSLGSGDRSPQASGLCSETCHVVGQGLGLGHQPSPRAAEHPDSTQVKGHRNQARGEGSQLLLPSSSQCPHVSRPESRAIGEALALVDGGHRAKVTSLPLPRLRDSTSIKTKSKPKVLQIVFSRAFCCTSFFRCYFLYLTLRICYFYILHKK